MSFIFENLDAGTRGAMIAELDGDMLGGGVALSPHLTSEGARQYPALLRAALAHGSPVTLEADLTAPGIFEPTEHSPSRTAQLIAESEFNRFYIRGLCSRVITDGGTLVEVYQARPRAASESKIGVLLDAATLLDDLRRHADDTPTILPDINSGLSVRIPD